MKAALAAALFASALISGSPALAGSITSPVGGAIITGGPGDGNFVDTYNRNGLNTPFVSGVTDFDSYVLTNPIHTLIFPGFEWFSNAGTTSASVYYDMGATLTMSALALWNEEFAGIGSLTLSTSDDATTWSTWATGLVPADSPAAQSYGVEVFNLSDRTARYVRFDMSGCPQPDGNNYTSCSIGEVAFNVATATPEPASLAIMAAGLLGLAVRRRRG